MSRRRVRRRHSGRFVLRIPTHLHAWLADRAKKNGVSMNTAIVFLIGVGLGHMARDRQDKTNDSPMTAAKPQDRPNR